MAYISIETVAALRQKIKPELKKMNLSATLKRENYHKVVMSVKSNGKLINEYYSDKFNGYEEYFFEQLTEEEKQIYFLYKKRRDEIAKLKENLKNLLLTPDFRDNSDPMTDYFDVSYYIDIKVIN